MSAVGGGRIKAEVVGLLRRNNSPAGNPNWTVFVKAPDSTVVHLYTQNDSAVAYTIGDSLIGKTIVATVTPGGYIESMVVDEQ